MFTPQQYRAKAVEYRELLKTTSALNEVRKYQQLERSFTMLADNEQWLADNHCKTVHAPGPRGISDMPLAAKDQHILRC